MSYIDFGKLIQNLRYNWVPIILLILAIYDLRIDIRLLLDFFTFSSLYFTISEHPLAISILLIVPFFFKSIK